VEQGLRFCSLFFRAAGSIKYYSTAKPQAPVTIKKVEQNLATLLGGEIQGEQQRYTPFKEGDVLLLLTW
jgi:hypothetical protein